MNTIRIAAMQDHLVQRYRAAKVTRALERLQRTPPISADVRRWPDLQFDAHLTVTTERYFCSAS